MYIFDTNVFCGMGHFFPQRFPTIWSKMDELISLGQLRSVKEVRRELENRSHFEHIDDWVKKHYVIFIPPSEAESVIVTQMFQKEQYRGLVKRDKILKGLPVADPFIIAAAKVHRACVVTQESLKPGGARIPTVCSEFKIDCIDLEGFLEQQHVKY